MIKRYDAYKPSGVEWIGDIPEHWEVKRLKWTARFEYGDSLAVADRQDGVIPVFGSNGTAGFHDTAIINQAVTKGLDLDSRDARIKGLRDGKSETGRIVW